jgi:Flp pilus assembly protein TadD
MLKLHSREHERIFRELAIAENDIPSCSLCYLAQSKAHQEVGDLEAAIADLESAVRLAPDYAEAWYHMAYLYERLGRHAQAARARQRFQELKARKENHETEMLRNAFIQTLGGAGSRASP